MKLSNDVKLARFARQVHKRRRVSTVLEITIGVAARDFSVISRLTRPPVVPRPFLRPGKSPVP